MHAYQEQLDEQVILLLLINKRSMSCKKKIISTAKDWKKHFKCASCLIGTVTYPNSSSKIQHTMKTERSNQKNTKKTLAIKESKLLRPLH
jgi:GTPase involved in cell partitioning and DNA repair